MASQSLQNRPWTILVVEDEVLVRMLISDYLQECGYKVLEAGSASEAVQILETQLAPVDVIFTDVKMPGPMDGIHLATWVHEHRPELPVVLTSGEISDARIEDIFGEDEPFFRKPYDVHEVVGCIQKFIDGRKAH